MAGGGGAELRGRRRRLPVTGSPALSTDRCASIRHGFAERADDPQIAAMGDKLAAGLWASPMMRRLAMLCRSYRLEKSTGRRLLWAAVKLTAGRCWPYAVR